MFLREEDLNSAVILHLRTAPGLRLIPRVPPDCVSLSIAWSTGIFQNEFSGPNPPNFRHSCTIVQCQLNSSGGCVHNQVVIYKAPEVHLVDGRKMEFQWPLNHELAQKGHPRLQTGNGPAKGNSLCEVWCSSTQSTKPHKINQKNGSSCCTCAPPWTPAIEPCDMTPDSVERSLNTASWNLSPTSVFLE